MVRKTVDAGENEPEQRQFKIPSEKEHLLQVSDIYEHTSEIGMKLGLDEDTVAVQCEVIGGDEAGRTLLQWLSLNPEWKGFFATRLFLKAIGLPHKGVILINTDDWQVAQFYATVVHNKSGDKTYANIAEYNFEKIIGTHHVTKEAPAIKPTDEIAWDDEK